jgi:DNA-binding transcriptional LysR family regulator
VDIPWRTRQLSRYAGLFFAEIEQGIEELALAENGAQGQLKIGSLPLAQTHIVPAAILQLLVTYPAANVSVVDGPYEEQLQALLHGQLDIIVGALRQPAPSNDIVQHSLFSDELSVVVRSGHPLAGQASITLAQLKQFPWIAPRKSTPARALFEQLFTDEQLSPPTNIIECSSLVVSRGILLASDRLGLLPAKQVAVELQAGLLQLCPIILTGTARAIGYSVRKNWQPTRIQAQFISLLNRLT